MDLNRLVSTLDQQFEQYHNTEAETEAGRHRVGLRDQGGKKKAVFPKAPTSIHALPCNCMLCDKKMKYPAPPLKNSPDALVEHDWQLRDATIKKLGLGKTDFDFGFVLRRIRNPIGANQLTLALVPTALFEEGNCFMFVSMDPQKYFARPRFITDANKLAGFNLEKLIAQPQPEEYYNHETVVRQRELKNRGQAKNARNSLFGSGGNSKESRPGSAQRSRASSEGSPTLSPSRIGGSSAFTGEQGGAELIKYSLLLKKIGNSSKIDFSRHQLLQCLQVGKDQRSLKQVMYIQKLLPGKVERLDTFRKRFYLPTYEENSQNRHTVQVQLFKKAIGEPMSITGRIQKISNSFRTPEQEVEILLGYQHKDAHLYAEYVNCKIYHALNVFCNIQARSFISEFSMDQFGNVLLSDVFLIDLDSRSGKEPGSLIGKDLAAYQIAQLDVQVQREAQERQGVYGLFGQLGGMLSGGSDRGSDMGINFANLFALPELPIPPKKSERQVRRALTLRGGGQAKNKIELSKLHQVGTEVSAVEYLQPGGKARLLKHKRHAEILSRSTNPDIWHDDPTPNRGVWRFEHDRHRVKQTHRADEYDCRYLSQSVERQEWGEDLLINIGQRRAAIEQRKDWVGLSKLEIWEDERVLPGYKSTLKGILLG